MTHVRCSHCSALYPETDTKCPSCGNPPGSVVHQELVRPSVPRNVRVTGIAKGALVGLVIGAVAGPLVLLIGLTLPAMMSGAASGVGGELNQKTGLPFTHFSDNYNKAVKAHDVPRVSSMAFILTSVASALLLSVIGGKFGYTMQSVKWNSQQRAQNAKNRQRSVQPGQGSGLQVPEGKWRCECGRVNDDLFSYCQDCQQNRVEMS